MNIYGRLYSGKERQLADMPDAEVTGEVDMDVPEKRRAWQILWFRHKLLIGEKQDYTTILTKAMVGYYDRDLTNRELPNKLREIIFKEADKIRNSLGELTYPAIIRT